MKKVILFLFVAFSVSFSLTSHAQAAVSVPASTSLEDSKSGAVITVKVNGLICSFCAQGIKKRLMTLTAVKEVRVDLNKKLVFISLKPHQSLSDKTIQDTIKDAGYAVVKIDR